MMKVYLKMTGRLSQFRQRKLTQTNHRVKGIVCLLSQAWWECLSLFTEASLFLHLTLSICSPKSLPFLSDPFVSCMRTAPLYSLEFFTQFSLLSFKISATQILISFFGSILKILSSSFAPHRCEKYASSDKSFFRVPSPHSLSPSL